MIPPRKLRISIIVPSFNQAPFLGTTLDSILGQDYPPHQVLVMDGGSTDGSVELIRQYAEQFPSLQWLSEPDNGPAEAVNKGLARVTGDVIGIQSSDDIYYPGALTTVADAFGSNPQCGLMYGDYDRIDEHGDILYKTHLPEFSWEAFFGISCSILQNSVFFRTQVARQVGGWNGEFYGCDLDYWLRLALHTQTLHTPNTLSAWRCYVGQRTHPAAFMKLWEGYWRMIDESSELAQAPAKVRRLARASKHLRVLRNSPSASTLFILRHLLVGFALHPTFWRYNKPAQLLKWMPGFPYMRAAYRSLRQWSGKPRPSGKAPVVKPDHSAL